MKREIKVTFVLVFIFSFSFFVSQLHAQEKLDYEAKTLEGGIRNGLSYKKLIGNVKFTQGKTIIYCDSAMAYDKTNSMEAFGRVRIEDLEDSVTITSNKLFYDGNGRTAQLRGDVVYVDDTIRLFTDNLDYDMINKSANYFNGGRIVDGENTIESSKGNYDTEGKMMIFTDSVKITTKDRTLESDDLVYNMLTKKAKTSSKTKITTRDGRVLNSDKNTEFDFRDGKYLFSDGDIDTDKYYIKGDKLYYNSQLGSYSAIGNVYLLAKQDDIIITGEEANFWEDKGIAEIYGKPLLKRALNEDTLFLRADTLISIDDSLEINKRLLAYRNVEIFKNDLQGKADSMAYFLSDSLIIFYNDPILWNDGSQITADTIEIMMKDGTINRLNALVNSFIISTDSTDHYNQIKGRTLTAFFKEQTINNVDVNGNGETIYFIANEENTSQVIGMNKIICSDIKIGFKENQVNDIRFYVNPEGDFVPPHELSDGDEKLEGFAWRVDERPTKDFIITGEREEPEKTELVDAVEEGKTELNELIKQNLDVKKIRKTLKKPIEKKETQQ